MRTLKRLSPLAVVVPAVLLLLLGVVPAGAVVVYDCNGDQVADGTTTGCTLQQLFENPGSSIQVNDKLFSNWAPQGSNPTVASTILVTGLDDGGLDPGPGLQYSTTEPLLSPLAFDWDLTVTVLDPSLLIKDNSLSLGDVSFQADGGDGAFFQVFESLDLDQDGAHDTGKNVCIGFADLADNCDAQPDGAFTVRTFDSLDFAPTDGLDVSMALNLVATDDGVLQVEFQVQSRFSQVAVPAPATLGLLAAGLAGIGACRWRRARRR